MAVSNIVMALPVMITLFFLTPLFYHTPIVVLSAIIISTMLGLLIDYQAAIHPWHVDKFAVCMNAHIAVVFGSFKIGLMVAKAVSLHRVLLFVVRPKTSVLGNIQIQRYREVWISTQLRATSQEYLYWTFQLQAMCLELMQAFKPFWIADCSKQPRNLFRWGQ